MRCQYFLPFFFFFACNASTEKTETKASDSTDVAERVAAFEASKLKAADIPETIAYEGEVKDVYRWTDQNGDNIFFVTVKGPYPDNDKGEAEEEGKTADLYAFHYAKKDEVDYKLMWKMHDQELSCPFDITTEIIPGSVTVTDLDKNGVGEAKFQYALACRSDVSPASMKLVMEENAKLYTLTGNRWVEFSPEFKFDVNASNVNLEKLPMLDDGEDDLLRSYGRYRSEKEFASAPPAFLEYARNEWIKYVIEKF
jgi:hypothetical protein